MGVLLEQGRGGAVRGDGLCWWPVQATRAPGQIREAEKSPGWQVSRDRMPQQSDLHPGATGSSRPGAGNGT